MVQRIFLVRHGQSEANIDKATNARMADHAINLTEEGHKQAKKAGAFLNGWLDNKVGDDEYVRMWHSPYSRTKQTAINVFSECELSINDKKEHFLLHEQQFGIFDGLSDEERKEQFPLEWEHYQKCKKFGGKVWAKLPMGESRIDVAARMHQTFGTFHRDHQKHGIKNLVIVGHGTTNRAFTMAWLSLPYTWFENEPNPKNCSIRLIENKKDMGYIYPGFDL